MSDEETLELSFKITQKTNEQLRKKFRNPPYEELQQEECSTRIRKNFFRRVKLLFKLRDLEKQFLCAAKIACRAYSWEEEDLWMLITDIVPEQLKEFQHFLLGNTHFKELISDELLEKILHQAGEKAYEVLSAIADARRNNKFFIQFIKNAPSLFL